MKQTKFKKVVKWKDNKIEDDIKWASMFMVSFFTSLLLFGLDVNNSISLWILCGMCGITTILLDKVKKRIYWVKINDKE